MEINQKQNKHADNSSPAKFFTKRRKNHICMCFRNSFSKALSYSLSGYSSTGHGPYSICYLVTSKHFIIPGVLPYCFSVHQALDGTGNNLIEKWNLIEQKKTCNYDQCHDR